MSPAKSEGSSRCKGKEAIIDKPLASGERGKEAPHFESDRSEDEETTRDLDSECPPLINPWYDTHSHFLVVPSDYLPPLLGRVWLFLEWCDFHTSWVPLASSFLDLAIRREETLPVPILFKFRSGTSLGWKEWVDKELSNVGFMEALQRASFLKAIVSLRCLYNYCGLFNLYYFVRWWSCVALPIPSFFLSYSELTMTLKDIANQLLLPILVDMDPSDIQLSTEEKAIEVELRKGLSDGNAKLSNWIGAFFEASTIVQHAAFIIFWLCKFVFGSYPYYVIKPMYF